MPKGVYLHKRRSLEERFWAKVDKRGPTDCWEWQAGKFKSGDGGICIGGYNGKILHANRVSWELHYGPIPEGQYVLHTCDNRGCVNPAHLFLGTQADNMRDMAEKERQARGEAIGTSKLTNKQVRQVRYFLKLGYSKCEIARIFKISEAAIYKIDVGETWAWLKEESVEAY